MMRRSLAQFFKILCLLVGGLAIHSNSWAIGQCPAIGYSTSCSALITINRNGSLKIQIDSSVSPYDGVEDSLVGVINNSGATVYGIKLTGSDIFGLDGDGAFGGNNYSGPNTNFTIAPDGNSGVVSFNGDRGLSNGQFAYFSLEGLPSVIKLAQTITIDPGHGTTCALIHQKVGAVGTKIYPANNPPAGPLREDNLTVNVATILASLLVHDSYKVTLTKTSVTVCPTLLERAQLANSRRSNMFVSIHFDAPAVGIKGILQFPGSEGIYNSVKSSSKSLALFVATDTSSALGVNNRGVTIENTFGVLKPTSSRMTAIIIETARLSAPDDDIVHASGATTRAANGIRAGINEFVNQ